MGFINVTVLIFRLHWLEKQLKPIHPKLLQNRGLNVLHEADARSRMVSGPTDNEEELYAENIGLLQEQHSPHERHVIRDAPGRTRVGTGPEETSQLRQARSHILFAQDPRQQQANPEKTLYIPPPAAREVGHPFVEVDNCDNEDTADEDSQDTEASKAKSNGHPMDMASDLPRGGRAVPRATSIERATRSIFVLGSDHGERGKRTAAREEFALPQLSTSATIGRNSNFYNLCATDRQLLGGIEYRAVKLLLKIVTVYFFGLHLFGAICLAGWIQPADPKFQEYLQGQGQDRTWWGFYSSATMVNNLGFTLTPDSMTMFKDATFPMLVMIFLAYAGNTCYPLFLRMVIWAMKLAVPRSSALQEPLQFLLSHPRRCYTLLFPSRPTWILFGILFALNFMDIVLMITLDLDNTAVNDLSLGPRLLASLFQAASSRHTGTSVYNLADVNPAVQFYLLVMMYTAVFPIAISIRTSNAYEERSLGLYSLKHDLDERNGGSHLLSHLRNQLSFDLWFIFLGIFCICIAESDHIMDSNDAAFAVFPIVFEVVSAYGNVGLSLGHPSNLTSLSGQFSTFSKLVICAMMIRGRHRMMPYSLDRAIKLPGEDEFADGEILE